VTLVDRVVNPRGATWNRKAILYAPTANSGLFSVSENGGVAVPTVARRRFRYFASLALFLPDDRHFVFLVWTNNGAVRDSIGGLYLGTLGSREVKRIAPHQTRHSSTASS
jgi:hypothetical protein